MLPIRPTAQFKRDIKRAKKQGHDIDHLISVLERISEMKPLARSYRDHKLKGHWKDFRECHIESDWLLIYTITDFELRPARLGTHDALFE